MSILDKLRGGDLRSIGRSNEVVDEVMNSPALFEVVFEGMLHQDPIIRMRAADAVEKISSKHPEYLRPFKKRLINEVAEIDQQEVKWHVAQMFSYLTFTTKERNQVVNILNSYLKDKSNIVKTFSMQALSDLALEDEALKPSVIKTIKTLMKDGSPAILSRGKKLLRELE